jgi:hypothetical protein
MHQAVDWNHLAQDSLVVDFCRHFNKISQSINGSKYLD